MFDGIICHIPLSYLKCQILLPTGEIITFDKEQIILGLINTCYMIENYYITLVGSLEYCEEYKKQIELKEKQLYNFNKIKINVIKGENK